MWGHSLCIGCETEICIFLTIGRVDQSPGLWGPRGEARETGLILMAQHVTLMPRQCWFQSLGMPGGHMWCVGSTKVRVVPTRARQAEPVPGTGWMLVDAG